MLILLLFYFALFLGLLWTIVINEVLVIVEHLKYVCEIGKGFIYGLCLTNTPEVDKNEPRVIFINLFS